MNCHLKRRGCLNITHAFGIILALYYNEIRYYGIKNNNLKLFHGFADI